MSKIDFDHDVTEQEAVAMMCYHLELAAAYFEASYEKMSDNEQAMLRCKIAQNFYALPAAHAFMEVLERQYAANS